MTIRWDNDRYKWLVLDQDITDEEFGKLSTQHREPDWYDSWEGGDVHYYDQFEAIGVLIRTCKEVGVSLEIIY